MIQILKKTLPVTLATLLMCGGCGQEEMEIPGADIQTITLTLCIGTQGTEAGIRATDPNVLPYEGIRTLRVIIAEGPGGKISYNELHTVDNSTDPSEAVLATTLTLQDVPVGKGYIYIIANEESIGMEYDDQTLEDNFNESNQKLLFIDMQRSQFPKRYKEIQQYGLPMSGQTSEINITPDMTDPISVTLARTVVKLNLTIVNNTTAALTLQKVLFGAFSSDRFYMFRKQVMDVPKGTQYASLEYANENVTLPSGQSTHWDCAYIYPNFAYRNPTGANPYTLSLVTAGKTYPPSQLANNMNSLVRNTQLNITATITASATISIIYEFVPWTEKEITVPPFN